MKYMVFFAGLWLASNESFGLDLAAAGLVMAAASGLLIIDRINEALKDNNRI